MWRWSPGLSLLVLGCTGTERTLFEDDGALCLRSLPDGTLEVQVTFPGCLSSNCDRVISSSCSVGRSGQEIRIESDGVVESKTGTRSCLDDCGALTASCVSSAIEPGSYTVARGEETVGVSLPTSGAALFDEASRSNCDLPVASPP